MAVYSKFMLVGIFKHIESFKYPWYTLEFEITGVLLEMAPKLGNYSG